MFSIVIRNKNEAFYLNRVLHILTTIYAHDFDEIIIVDNNSTDDSISIAQKYNCKVVNISDFTYGGAINLGVSQAKNNYVLLLSSHAIPIGKSFFKNTLKVLKENNEIAGVRYVNSIDNYERALKNNNIVQEPLKYGLMAACCIVVKAVWEKNKFDEKLEASEDKEWSQQVTNLGYNIYDIDETYFYFINRTNKSNINRYKIETLAYHQLFNIKSPSRIKIFGSLIKKIFITNTKSYISQIISDVKKTKAKFYIYNQLKKDKNDKTS